MVALVYLEEAERDPVLRGAWLLRAEKRLAIGCGSRGPVGIVIECRDIGSAPGVPDNHQIRMFDVVSGCRPEGPSQPKPSTNLTANIPLRMHTCRKRAQAQAAVR